MKVTTRLWTVLTVLLLLVVFVAPIQASGPITDEPGQAPKLDNRPDPLTTQQLALKDQAVQAKLNGKAHGKTHEVAKGQYVELELEGTGMVWTVMGEFSDLKHNQIPQPDRSVDNSTLWVPDFSKAHMDGLLYDKTPGANSMANFYLEQSSGRYTVAGEATDWVAVPGEMASYNDDLDDPAAAMRSGTS